VLLAAEIVSPIFRWPRQWCAVAVMLILLTAAVLQVTARGANQPFERITKDQIAAVRVVEAKMTDETTIGYFNDFNPTGLLKPRYPKPFSLEDCELDEPAASVVDAADGVGKEIACVNQVKPDWVYASSSQAAYGTLVEGRPIGWLDGIVSDLIATGDYEVAINDPHVTVLKRFTQEDS